VAADSVAAIDLIYGALLDAGVAGGALPARQRPAEVLERPVDWDEEFEADIETLSF
jgi:hypothetical protein